MPVPQKYFLSVEWASCPLGTGKMPVPQKIFSFCEWASCPFQDLIKKTFARYLFKMVQNIS